MNMDACAAVEREVDRVLSKFSDIEQHVRNNLQEILQHIQGIKSELHEGFNNGELSAGQSLLLGECVKRVRDLVSKVSLEHKDLHGSVSKVGKAVDRNFVSDFSTVVNDSTFEDTNRPDEINKVICEHFLRQGMLDIAERLIYESGIDIDPDEKEPFLELHRILEALKAQDLQPALNWAQANRDRLQAQHSSLEFKLHRLKFIDLVQEGADKQTEALEYARNFAPFAASHAKELQVLMGSLLYLRHGLDKSPYAYLTDPINWADICDVFTRDACALLGLSVESPLSVVMKAGCIALPPLLTIKQVMQQRQCSGVWSAKDELPVEIDLGSECHFHSIFACPILRQQSTENNPPMRLVCGHVISRDALNKLSNANKVKCPYCPVEQSLSDARQIYF